MPNTTLKGKGAVITGGGRGIGKEVAELLASQGAAVVVVARSTGQIEAVAASLRAQGYNAWAVSCDVSKPESIEAMALVAQAHLKSVGAEVDILVNNAGIAPSSPIDRISLDEWNTTMAVNVTGPLLCIQAFLGGMKKRRWGRVVNVASVASFVGGRYIAAYASSKHALLGLTRCLASEVSNRGITSNAVCPGFVDTEMMDVSIQKVMAATQRTHEESLKSILSTNSQKRLITTAEVARTVAFLCHPDASGVNGQGIIIDGGGLPI